MGNSGKWKFGFLRIGLGLAILISLPFIHYYFWNFYSGTLEEYMNWYPNTYFIVFPIIKIFPFAVLGFIVWLTRMQLSDFYLISGRWLVRNYKSILLSLVIVIITLIAGEFVLRKAGFKPGYRVYSQYFQPVDSLFLLDGFTADSNGILTVSAKAREFICEELERKNCTYELNPLSETQSAQVYVVPKHFVTFHGYNYKSTFKTFLKKFEEAADTSDFDFIEAVNEYSHCPINHDGFKSIEFKRYKSKRKSVLLLGDSFAWGNEASNLTNGFADLLLAKGYIVYNTGITGTDPAQYLEVARKYIPALKPDFVVVNFYIGNDVIYFERKPKPYIPVLYCTNAGNLLACPEGVYFETAEEAYQYTLAHFNIPKEDSWFNKMSSKTVLSTLLWKAITKWNPEWTMFRYNAYYEQIEKVKTKTPYSDLLLKEIRQITHDSGADFILTVIPKFDGHEFISPKHYSVLFEGMQYDVPPFSAAHYVNREDGHYNDRGHAMHAIFIDSLIKSLLL